MLWISRYRIGLGLSCLNISVNLLQRTWQSIVQNPTSSGEQEKRKIVRDPSTSLRFAPAFAQMLQRGRQDDGKGNKRGTPFLAREARALP
jgi:hypothetical protein